MCGIGGIFSSEEKSNNIRLMVNSMNRRGPDDSGIYISDSGKVALGQTRLSIIDLTDTGHQPMRSHNGRYTIVFNGEIYNYKELQAILKAKGAIFITESDTEVILWAWEIFGTKAPCYFRGMFAFAIWDELNQSLSLVRDRMGIKPLLWSSNGSHFIFASSIKAMLSSGSIEPVLNKESFFDFLSTGSVRQPRTIIDGVFSLKPGTVLTVKGISNIHHETYWELKRNENLASDYLKADYMDLVQQTRNLLEETCRYHMTADVQVGSFLSGGIDSTAITALMAGISAYKIKTFTIGFENEGNLKNELLEAKLAADFIGTDHTEALLTGDDVKNSFDDFISVMDQPSNDGLITYWVNKIAHTHVKVALSGLGGDEIFAGYNHFSWPLVYANRETHFAKKTLSYINDKYPWLYYTNNAFLRTLNPVERLANLRKAMHDKDIKDGISAELAPYFQKNRILQQIVEKGIGQKNTIYDISLYECNNYLLNTLLRDVDAYSMGNSIEVRPILLDHILVEHALSLPGESKWRNGISKAVFKDAISIVLPPSLLQRPKTGFTLPTTKWINQDLEKRFLDTLNNTYSEKFFTRLLLDNIIKNRANPHLNQNTYMIFVFLEWAILNKIQY